VEALHRMKAFDMIVPMALARPPLSTGALKLLRCAMGQNQNVVDRVVGLGLPAWLLQCREQWLAQWPRPPTNATVAYHYTSAQAIPTIRQVGLLSQKERQQNNAVTNKAFNGAVYGDGKALVPQL
jgi:hypothetical protein